MGRQVAVEHTISAAVAKGGTFTVNYPSGYVQGDFSGDDSSTSIDQIDYKNLATTLGASAATITWPATAHTALAVGDKLTIGLDLLNKSKVELLPNQANTDAAATLATLIADFNALLSKLKAADLMVDD